MPLFKADFHIHSCYSMDCTTSLSDIIRTCQRKGLNCIALADHGSIEGALKIQDLAPFKVIIAEEILTTNGEIMGIFLTRKVPSGLSMEESIRLIKEQGGLLCAQHPYDKIRPDSLKSEVMDRIAPEIDLVEVFNARNPLRNSSVLAAKFALEHDLPGCAGSDAHSAYEIGNAYIEMPEFKGKEDFLQALRKGKIIGRRTGPIGRLSGFVARLKKNSAWPSKPR
jgi:predicted metal-dependent phosphoesterase TrpH